QYPGYFTFCETTDFNEDQTIRHIEPAMTYQLELTRLSNFDITPCYTDNRQIVSSEHKNSDCNHLFINFIPTFVLEPKQVEEAVKGFINRHKKRLWRLRVTEAEVCFKVEDPTLVTSYPLRVIINNVSGVQCTCNQPTHFTNKRMASTKRYKAHLMGTAYASGGKEWENAIRTLRNGINRLLNDHNVDKFERNNTLCAYAYDFPELFRQAIRILWNRASHRSSNLKCPSDVLEAKELVLDENNNLQEVEKALETN
ncbi:18318_t:CDS:2, partial [Funneliformis geosporum]